jgi:oxygen-dependent protoporphyrinogen oxidase
MPSEPKAPRIWSAESTRANPAASSLGRVKTVLKNLLNPFRPRPRPAPPPAPPANSPRIAILGGGIAGLTAAWQLAKLGNPHFTLFEATGRLGGTVHTVRHRGFLLELGPDGWVTEKPWARELAEDLGLGDEIIASNDAERVTYLVLNGKLVAIPAGMRMMVPTDLAALEGSPLFSAQAKRAYAAEPARASQLRAAAPNHDESIATFVSRHFGPEVLAKVAAPLLSGVFGGDVRQLSVRAVMPQFVKMEREHGSLIAALQQARAKAGNSPPRPIFTSLRGGVGTLVDRMAAQLPAGTLRLRTPVTGLARQGKRWLVHTATGPQAFDKVLVALPAHAARHLLRPISGPAANLLRLQASSAILVAFAFDQNFPLPRGFGFLVPAAERSRLLAATFVDQKFPHRAPEGKRILRAFFGGPTAPGIQTQPDTAIAALALTELEPILGELPTPKLALIQRWPQSLPQYQVGHPERITELEQTVAGLPGLRLIGNTYHGVGLPDVIREARAAASSALEQ